MSEELPRKKPSQRAKNSLSSKNNEVIEQLIAELKQRMSLDLSLSFRYEYRASGKVLNIKVGLLIDDEVIAEKEADVSGIAATKGYGF